MQEMTRSLKIFLARIRRDRAGVSVIEFAIVLPLLLFVTLTLIELVNFVLVRQQISQLALLVADNASRIGTQNTIQSQIDEKQVNDLFRGASLQASGLDIATKGRVILSSLEKASDPPKGQYIHWQRCFGAFRYTSSYGKQGDGKGNNSFKDMGPTNGKVIALDGVPAMFVEIAYQYQPLISPYFTPTAPIQETASMLVRDSRDTSEPGINPVAGVTASTC
jgi:hypothetical protein